jgi:hypothetical protein
MRSLRGISFLFLPPIDIRWMRRSSVKRRNQIHLLPRQSTAERKERNCKKGETAAAETLDR